MNTSKSMANKEISELLRSIAAAHQLKDANRFRFQIIAYNRAADSVEHATSELKDLWDDGKLDEVPGIGKSIAGHLSEIFKTGKSKHFEEITKGIDPRVFKLMELPGIGIKTAIKMVDEASKSEINSKLKEVAKTRKKNNRLFLPYAENIASEVTEWLLNEPNSKKVESLGSLRRHVATIGDVDIAVASNNPQKTLDHFVKYPKSQKTIENGDKTASILLPNNVQVDLLVCPEKEFGSALQHFTGSKHHNIALREYSLKKGLSLSEYGIKNKKTDKLTKFSNEKDFYNFLKLDYIEPELREDAGEIDAAKNHKLPELVDLKDIRGDLQIHSSFDIETSHDLGVSSMGEIVTKANELNYEYIAFTEHNPSKSKHSEEEIVKILMKKKKAIDEINYSIMKNNTRLRETSARQVKKVFNSLEIDISPDGKLSVNEKGLATLDFALVSIHSSFELSKDKMTKRVLSALSYPKVKIFAHPTARKLNEREGIELDWPKIFDFCVKNNKIIEINASPSRLDLPDTLVRDGLKAGVKFSLGTDSHELTQMDYMKYGVYVARRGWCEKSDIINCLSYNEFEEVIMK